MQAAVLVGKEHLEIQDVLPATPGEDEVTIEVRSSGVCGTDVHIYRGAEGSTDAVFPLIMGHEFSGVVSVVGSKVKDILPGDKAIVNPNIMCGYCNPCRSGHNAFCENHIAVGVNRPGGFAEKITVPKLAVHTFVKSDFDTAAMIEPLSCCLNVFETMPHSLGDSYLIVGGGPIGMMMLQLARLAGARFLAVAELVAAKREKCLRLGADVAFDSRGVPASMAARHHGIKQFDMVIDCVGLPLTQSYSLEAAGRGSRVMFFGLGGAKDILEVKPYTLFNRQVPVYSSFINPYTFTRTVEIVESGRVNLSDIVGAHIGFQDLAAVLEDDTTRSEGKVILKL
ncbi:MAG: alcohol dehydrogenase catalytic domain-containing protein [Planctomycetota bacterium]|jgi:threonine dehydrogenase-like Zn-dependent dehydrogenase|nr:alcohol dehydrogenase catalytic domain-containing protein [Planctomycetota bacterium]